MGRPKTGGTVWRGANLYVRISYTDETGQRRRTERRVLSNRLTDAPDIARGVLNKLDAAGPQIIEGEKRTFAQVAAEFEKERLQPPTYHDGHKTDGSRSYRNRRNFLKAVITHFGPKPISQITYREIAAYKQQRLNTPRQRGGQRTIAGINRELEEMQRVLKYAMQQGWLLRNPFQLGKPLIQRSAERERIRVLSYDEEKKLLAACNQVKSQHLRAVIIIGIDTFIRKSELFRLTPASIAYHDGSAYLQLFSTTTKTEKPREVGLTQRALSKLLELAEGRQSNERLFQTADCKRGWNAACRLAGIDDARIQDLRHTGITRRLEAVVKANLPWQIVMRESGHTQMKTFMRYFNPEIRLLIEAADAMATQHASALTTILK